MKRDELGAVFAPAPERGIHLPVYAYGSDPKLKDPVFTCPVSAIPDAVWSLLELFLTCRAMKALPKAGGVLDQPYIVRKAWPILEAELGPIEKRRDQAASMSSTVALLAAMSGRGK